MSSLSKSIALFGSHTKEFISEVQKAGYEPVKCMSSDELKFDSSLHAIVAVSGDDHGFSDPILLSKVVLAGLVLIAFAPGDEFLVALHAATKTPIDLTKIETTAERPLMVYKEHDTIRVVLPPTDSVVTDVQAAGSDAEFTVGPKDLDTASSPSFHASDLVTLMNSAMSNIHGTPLDGLAPRDNLSLDPGNDVAFFNKVIVDFPHSFKIGRLAWTPDGKYNVATSDSKVMQGYLLSWQITLYVYATNQDPTGKTTANYTGTIYTYMVHDGAFVHDSGSAPRWLGPNSSVPGKSHCAFYFVDYLEYIINDRTGSLRRLTQQPDSNLYQRDASNGVVTFRYDISQKQSMTLFRASKKQTWNFQAVYEKPCAWQYFQLHNGGVDTQSSQNLTGLSLAYNDYYDFWADPGFKTNGWWQPGVFTPSIDAVKRLPDDNFKLAGLTVFSSSVGKIPLALQMSFRPRAFKDDKWRTDSDDSRIHRSWYTPGTQSSTQSITLDLTWD